MKNTYTLLFVAFFTVSMSSCSSCNKKTRDAICEPGQLAVYGTGYNAETFDSAWIWTYIPGSNFTGAIDSNRQSYQVESYDTCYIAWLKPGHEYKVIVNGTKTYRIANLTESGQTHKTFIYTTVRSFMCFNNIVSCTLNDTNTVCVPDRYENAPNTYLYLPK